jgi:hypothetical protein
MSGSGGGSTTNTVSEFKPPDYTVPKWNEYLDRAYEISNKYGTDPSLIYGNSANQPLVAQMSQLQNTASNGLYGLASQGGQNEGYSNAALQDMLTGKNQNIQPNNPYMGNSPEFEAMLKSSNDDITGQYQKGAAAQLDSSAARSGAFGGSAYNEMQQANQAGLAKQIANNTNQQRNAQFDKSAGLAESQINRTSNNYENAANRQLQAVQGVQNQGNIDAQRWQSVMGAGDLQRQVQSENIAAAKDLFGQNVQQPLQAADILGNALSRTSGQGGSTTSSSFGSGTSGLANGLGGLAALYGLFGK